MTAIIEWTHDANNRAEGIVEFPDVARWDDDYVHGVLFKTDKEYDFFAAVAGVRSRFEIDALFRRRGKPKNLSSPAADYFGRSGGECSGWLHLSEVDAAIAHVSAGNEFLIGFELQVGLDLMRRLVERLGDANVRLVFEIESA